MFPETNIHTSSALLHVKTLPITVLTLLIESVAR